MNLPIQYDPIINDILEAARDFTIDPVLIAAVIWVESRAGDALDSQGTGDNGHGKGLMQIDDRYHEFARTGNWQDARANIRYGTNLLRYMMNNLKEDQYCSVCAYNAGLTAVQESINKGIDPQTITHNGDYAKRVFYYVGKFA